MYVLIRHVHLNVRAEAQMAAGSEPSVWWKYNVSPWSLLATNPVQMWTNSPINPLPALLFYESQPWNLIILAFFGFHWHQRVVAAPSSLPAVPVQDHGERTWTLARPRCPSFWHILSLVLVLFQHLSLRRLPKDVKEDLVKSTLVDI